MSVHRKDKTHRYRKQSKKKHHNKKHYTPEQRWRYKKTWEIAIGKDAKNPKEWHDINQSLRKRPKSKRYKQRKEEKDKKSVVCLNSSKKGTGLIIKRSGVSFFRRRSSVRVGPRKPVRRALPYQVTIKFKKVSKGLNKNFELIMLAASLLASHNVILAVRLIAATKDIVVCAYDAINKTKELAKMVEVHPDGRILPTKAEFTQFVNAIKSYKNLLSSILDLAGLVSSLPED